MNAAHPAHADQNKTCTARQKRKEKKGQTSSKKNMNSLMNVWLGSFLFSPHFSELGGSSSQPGVRPAERERTDEPGRYPTRAIIRGNTTLVPICRVRLAFVGSGYIRLMEITLFWANHFFHPDFNLQPHQFAETESGGDPGSSSLLSFLFSVSYIILVININTVVLLYFKIKGSLNLCPMFFFFLFWSFCCFFYSSARL